MLKNLGKCGFKKNEIKAKKVVQNNKCAQCGKTFSQPEHLRSHLLTHTEEKSHKCAECTKSSVELNI